MWTRAQLKDRAKIALRGNYWKIVLVTLIVFVIGGASSYETTYEFDAEDLMLSGGTASSLFDIDGTIILMVLAVATIAILVGLCISIFLFYPLEIGTKRFFIKSLNQPAELNELTYGFERNYKNVVMILFLRGLYTFGWSLLFVIPGIVKAYEYQMIPYLLAENPNLTKEEAFSLSKQMMSGQKWEAFVLDLSFIGWELLASFTFGILSIFYVEPYRNLTLAALYDELSMIHGRPATAYDQSYAQEQVDPFGHNVQEEYIDPNDMI